MHAGKAPVIRLFTRRGQHAFVNEFNNPVGICGTGAAQVVKVQPGLVFKNKPGDVGRLVVLCHGWPPSLARGLKDLNSLAMLS